MRLSRILQTNASPDDEERVSVRRMLLWSVVALAILAGIVLYFKYERGLNPIVG
jgi:type VI protein secretion system component VasF